MAPSTIQFIAAVSFLLVGLSHLLRPREWASLFIRLRALEEPGVFLIVLMTFPIVSLIIGFHNVWSGLPTVLTIVGWIMCLKCAIYSVFPGIGLRALQKITTENVMKLRVVGVALIALSGLCWVMWADSH
ncbi:MAG: hypothetical protein ACF8GE_07030 [Phycisphaerales bacterium JB043]